MIFKWMKQRLMYRSIQRKNSLIKRTEIRSVLIFYDLNTFFIGDSMKSIANLILLKVFFPVAKIDLIATNPRLLVLLENSPYIGSATHGQYTDVPCDQYEVVLVVSDNERNIFDFFLGKYRLLAQRRFHCAVFSITNTAFNEGNPHWFPVYDDLNNYPFNAEDRTRVANTQIFLSQEELSWADAYLSKGGIDDGDKVVILPDSTSNSGKELTSDQFFKLVRLLLSIENVKVLIYDVNNLDKKSAYRKVLGEYLASRIFFAEGISLRESICLLGSKFISMIIGPCTGIMHCASGVHNTQRREDPPVIIVYKGSFDGIDESYEPYWWWGNNKAVECLVILKTSGALAYLSEIGGPVPCSDLDYTNKIQADQIFSNIARKFESRLKNKGLIMQPTAGALSL